jgi:hypothetical protein
MPQLIENFLQRGSITAIYGKPKSCQQFIAEEITFSAATESGHVVILADGPTEQKHLLDRFTSWRHARGVGAEVQLNIILIDAAAMADKKNFSTAFIGELTERGVEPALVMSARSATNMLGFGSSEARAEFDMAKAVIERFGCAVLLAGHTGPRGKSDDFFGEVNTLWEASEEYGRVTLKKDDITHTFIGKPAGGYGFMVMKIFDIEPTEAAQNA